MFGSPEGPRSGPSRRKRVPVSTWFGLGGTVLAALIGLAAGGFWSMMLMVAIVVLVTAFYGILFRRHTWLRLPRRRSAAAIGAGVALAVLIGSSSAYGATHPTSTAPVEAAAPVTASAPAHDAATKKIVHATASAKPTHTAKPKHTPTPTPTPTPVVTTKLVSETLAVPFGSSTVQSSTMAADTSSVTTAGANGVETKTYTVTYTDGVETGRVLTTDAVTTPPITQVTTIGTYVAPPPPAPAPTCTNGTYVNSAGNTVCRPEVSAGAPAGATARCGDGTYSFSQSRRGTCSSHGGVAAWL